MPTISTIPEITLAAGGSMPQLIACRLLLVLWFLSAPAMSRAENQPPSPTAPAPPPTTVTTTTPTGVTTTVAPSTDTQTTTTTISGSTTTTTAPATDTPSTGLDLGTGDIVFIRVDTPGFVAVDDSSKKYCAPAGTELQISNTTDDGGKKFYVRVVRTPSGGSSGFLGIGKSEARDKCDSKTSSDPPVEQNTQYLLDKKLLDSHEYGASGLEYGVLIAPYKFHIADRTLTSSATIGPYVGFHILTAPGSTLSEVLSIGIGNVPVTTESSPAGNPTTSDRVSLSVAGGYVLTLTKSGRFQLAFLTGFDWAGHGNEYKYEGKPWFGIGFGANLTK